MNLICKLFGHRKDIMFYPDYYKEEDTNNCTRCGGKTYEL